jgi:hypothetical protein
VGNEERLGAHVLVDRDHRVPPAGPFTWSVANKNTGTRLQVRCGRVAAGLRGGRSAFVSGRHNWD